MTTTEFSWNHPNNQNPVFKVGGNKIKLSDDVLLINIRWFITFRWLLITALILFEIVMLVASDSLAHLGISQHQKWPIVVIVILGSANIAYTYALGRLRSIKYNSPSLNLWAQIIIDLVCLSVVVHYVGSTSTPISFFYVLHIALACIFFSTRESLYVAVLVCVINTVVVVIESSIIAPISFSALMSNLSHGVIYQNNAVLWMFFLDILFLVVWYVVSRLSLIVRAHERHLLDAYKRINQAQIEKDQYAVLLTHQLKSPLDAIRSKINLIKGGYCGEATPSINDELDKINNRAQGMSSLILDLLRLERLKNTCLNTAVFKSIDIHSNLQKCIEKLMPVANSKHIALNVFIDNFMCKVIPDQLEILLENIIANAIIYSYDYSSIEITSEINHFDRSASIIVSDHGIGIESKDLPNIFNEYFYSPRAAMHNKASSGIGLSIVKIVAENNNLKIKVASEPGSGTSFAVIFKHIKLAPKEGGAQLVPLAKANVI